MTATFADIGDLAAAAIKAQGEGDPRSRQSAAGRIGASDLGFCRQKAALMTRGVPQSDSRSILAAQMGTAWHTYSEDALAKFYPDWIIDTRSVKATVPSGAVITGTPDIIAYNGIVDIKTVDDGFAWVKRYGASQQHRWQRHTYALGAMQNGLIDPDREVGVGCLYFDRSGDAKEPYFEWEPFDPMLTDIIDEWITDVTYAVANREDASRDVVAPVCREICEFFTVCRGNLPTSGETEPIVDDDRMKAVRMYLEGRTMESAGKAMKKSAGAALFGTEGVAVIDGKGWQVRNTWIGPSTVAASDRAGYNRIDVSAVKLPKGQPSSPSV